MQKKLIKNKLSSILCIVLIVAMALFTTACNDNESKETATTKETETTTSSNMEEDTTLGNAADDTESDNVLGEGNTKFMFTVVDQEGNETQFEIHTDKTTVGDALQEVGLIEGEEGEYGLYVKTVNGITADYDVDGTYWAFYINDEYAMSGVDTTEIEEGDSYSFKVE